MKVHLHNSWCLRKVINKGNAVAVYRFCAQGQSISQTHLRNVIHILYKGELTTQTIGNIFPSMCPMYWNKSYFGNITFGRTLQHALQCAAPELFPTAGYDSSEQNFWVQHYDWRHINALVYWYEHVTVNYLLGE